MKKFLFIILLIIIIGGLIGAYLGYQAIYAPNVTTGEKKYTLLYIPTGADFETVKDSLYARNIIENEMYFEELAKLKNYPQNVKPGRYRIQNNMSSNELINLLRAGKQDPVNVTFNNVRTLDVLAGRVSDKIEADSAAIMELVTDEQFINKYGKNKETILSLFIPDTYEFYWNTDAEGFVNRMAEEYKNYWNNERTSKAENLKMTPEEVATLASIVEHETYKNDDKPKIAGVYLNRLEIGMPLQADPTLIWALGDFSIKRVLNVHKEIESPYNTYKNRGLPPGPIGIPSKSSIDAVLNYEDHDYLYFVAKADFSGYSDFSKTYDEHLRKARLYQQELNKRNIR